MKLQRMVGRGDFERRTVWLTVFLAILVVAAVRPAPAQPATQVNPPGSANINPQNLDGVRFMFADLAAKVLPSVVTVYVKRDLKKEMTPEDLQKLEQLRQFRKFIQPFDMPGAPNQEDEGEQDLFAKGSGSGVIISADGYIVTNWHVVGNKDAGAEIRVVLSDNTELTGKDVQVIASNKLIDLALIKVNRSNLQPIPFGDSEALRIGERVAAIGSPLDLKATVTQGIICAKHRQVGMGLGDMLQTDAVINPGSSGGALVNLDGQLIGINRMISNFGMTGRWEGYGFAIPAKDVKYFVDQVMKKGDVAYGYIGVMMGGDVADTEKMHQALGIPKDQKGVLVMGVTPGQPADKAGLQEGDYIIAADGQPIEDTNDLLGYVARREVGSTIKLTVLRSDNGKKPREMRIGVEVAKRPDEEDLRRGLIGESEDETDGSQMPGMQNELGIAVEPYNEKGRQGLRIDYVQPGSPAAKAGLQPGDVLLKLNRTPLKATDDLSKAIKARPEGRPHLLQFTRKNQTMLTPIDAPSKQEKKKD